MHCPAQLANRALADRARAPRQALQGIQAVGKLVKRFCCCGPRKRQLRCIVPVCDSLIQQPRLRAMMGEQLRLALGRFPKVLLQHLGNTAVQLLAARFEEGAVRRILNERVLEAVGSVRRSAAAEDQLGRDELVES
jgi:hypothetical protein